MRSLWSSSFGEGGPVQRLHPDGLAYHPEFAGRIVDLCGGSTKGLCAPLYVKGTVQDAGEGIIDFRSSDATVDRYGEIISPEGWQLDNYRRNPVVQNAHNYSSIEHTIGKALHTAVMGDYLFQRVQFAIKEHPLALLAFNLYKGGYLNAVSVGFVPIRWENGNDPSEYRRKFLEQELLEVSAVSIPANPNALALAAKHGAVAKGELRDVLALLDNISRSIQTPSNQAAEVLQLADQISRMVNG